VRLRDLRAADLLIGRIPGLGVGSRKVGTSKSPFLIYILYSRIIIDQYHHPKLNHRADVLEVSKCPVIFMNTVVRYCAMLLKGQAIVLIDHKLCRLEGDAWESHYGLILRVSKTVPLI